MAGGSYGECTQDEIAEKLKSISRNHKDWSTRKSETRRNTFVVQALNNSTAYEIHEKMEHMRTKLEFILKHVGRGSLKVNMVNYLTKPPQPADSIAMKKIHMQFMIRLGFPTKRPRFQAG